MIIIEGNKVSNISLKDNNEIYKDKLLPAINLRLIGKEYICDIGNYNFSNNCFETDHIIIERVLVKKIAVTTSQIQLRYQNKQAKLFNYTIQVEALDKDGKSTGSKYAQHVFRAVDKIVISHNSQSSKEFCKSFWLLFSKVIPGINETLQNGVEPENINFEYFDLFFTELKRVVVDNDYLKFVFYWEEPIIKMEDVLHLIYTLNVKEKEPRHHVYKEEDHEFVIKSCKIKDMPANSYIENLIGLPIHVNCETTLESILCSWEIPEYIKYDEDTVKRGLIKYLYYRVITSFNDASAQLGFKVKYHNQQRYGVKPVVFSQEEEFLLNFILNMRVAVFVDGQSRVGRDDYSWTETSYIFSYDNGFKPSDSIINLINEVLGIQLKEEINNMRWYYMHESDSETIPGACYRYGSMNDESREPYFNRLFERIIKLISEKKKEIITC